MNSKYRRRTLGEAFWIVERAIFMFPVLRKAKRDGILSESSKERIMLAVTEVNGCAMCSYAHSKMALEAGLSNEEISSLLAGESSNLPEQELSAIMFAQHVAEQKGIPSKEAWKRMQSLYGERHAEAIFSAICVIMAGNTYGIPFGSLKSRIHGNKTDIDKRSSLPYELIMILSLLVILPIAFIMALLQKLLHIPVLRGN